MNLVDDDNLLALTELKKQVSQLSRELSYNELAVSGLLMMKEELIEMALYQSREPMASGESTSDSKLRHGCGFSGLFSLVPAWPGKGGKWIFRPSTKNQVRSGYTLINQVSLCMNSEF